MPIKSLNGLLGLAALGLLGACSTPCDVPGRLCAPILSNTSADQDHPAAAVRAGFMAGYERDRDGIVVDVIDSGDTPAQALDAYAAAVRTDDIVVGPLARQSVRAVATGASVDKPTIALNHPGADTPLPSRLLVMGLSIEDEARQVARWAADEHPGAAALIVSGASAWERRIAGAYAAQWKEQGGQARTVELPDSNGYLSEAALQQLKTQTDAAPPEVLLAAVDAGQLRQVRATLGSASAIAIYGTSTANPGADHAEALAELDGVRLLDQPWEVQPDDSAVMVYPRASGGQQTLDLERLYALGIDAFRVARETALHPGTRFTLDGVTGRLRVGWDTGAASFERSEPQVTVQDGRFVLIAPAH